MNKAKGRRHNRKKEYYKKYRAAYELKKAARAVKRARRIEAAKGNP